VNSAPEAEQPFWKAFVSWQMLILLVAAFAVWFTTAPSGIGGIGLASLSVNKDQAMEASDERIFAAVDKLKPPGSPQGPSISELFESGQTDEALQAARQLLKNNPYDLKTLMCAGDIFSQVPESTDEGFDLLRRSIQAVPQSRWVRLNYARKLAEAKRYEEAIPEYKKLADQYNDKWITPRYELAQLYLDQKEFAAASNELRVALQTDVKNGFARKQLGLCLAADNHLDDGFSEFKKGVSLDRLQGYPSEVEDLMEKNEFDAEKALVDLRSMIAESPDDADLKLDEARLLIATKKIDEAKIVLKDMLQKDKEDADAHLVLAEAFLAQNDERSALAEFKEAAKLVSEQ